MITTRIRRNLAALGLLMGVAAGLAGCTNKVFLVPIGGEGDPTARIAAIDIQNARGTIVVMVDPSITTPTVEARPFGAQRNVSAEPADSAWVQATLDKRGAANVLRVHAVHPDGPASPNRLHLVITVPGTESTIIRNNDGWVHVTGVSGLIEIQNGDVGIPGGDIQVKTDQPLRKSVRLETSSGYVALSIPPDSAGAFTLESPNGTTTFNSRSARVTNVESIAYSNRWSGVLNGGENIAVLRSGDGDVRVNIIDHPMRVSFKLSAYGQTAN